MRLRLMATYLVAMLLTALGAAAVLAAVLTWNMEGLSQLGLALQAGLIERGLRWDSAGQPVVAVEKDHKSIWIFKSISDDLKYRVVDGSGAVLLASDEKARALLAQGRAFDPSRSMFTVAADGIELRVLTVPVERQGARFYIQAARSTRLDKLAVQLIGTAMLKAALVTVLASLAVFAVAVYFTLRSRLRPLRDVSAAAARIAPNNLSARLVMRDLPTELAPLIDAFNLALDRLEKGYRVQQEFLSGAAHELKTPLALIRAQIEMDGAADRGSLLRDVDLMARQVHQLLNLAEVSESQNYAYEPTDLAAVASDVTGYLSRLADQRQVSLRVLGDAAGTRLSADRSALFVLLKNLAENAIHHSPAGGVVTLSIDADALRVRDVGAGIAPGDFPKLFERFWRSAQRRDEGAGLGLAICRAIATTHGWRLSAHNALPGAEFRLAFRPA